jgi:hypothetical protein
MTVATESPSGSGLTVAEVLRIAHQDAQNSTAISQASKSH